MVNICTFGDNNTYRSNSKVSFFKVATIHTGMLNKLYLKRKIFKRIELLRCSKTSSTTDELLPMNLLQSSQMQLDQDMAEEFQRNQPETEHVVAVH